MVHPDLVQIVEHVKAPKRAWRRLAPAFVCYGRLALFEGHTHQPSIAPLCRPGRRIVWRDREQTQVPFVARLDAIHHISSFGLDDGVAIPILVGTFLPTPIDEALLLAIFVRHTVVHTRTGPYGWKLAFLSGIGVSHVRHRVRAVLTVHKVELLRGVGHISGTHRRHSRVQTTDFVRRQPRIPQRQKCEPAVKRKRLSRRVVTPTTKQHLVGDHERVAPMHLKLLAQDVPRGLLAGQCVDFFPIQVQYEPLLSVNVGRQRHHVPFAVMDVVPGTITRIRPQKLSHRTITIQNRNGVYPVQPQRDLVIAVVHAGRYMAVARRGTAILALREIHLDLVCAIRVRTGVSMRKQP